MESGKEVGDPKKLGIVAKNGGRNAELVSGLEEGGHALVRNGQNGKMDTCCTYYV